MMKANRHRVGILLALAVLLASMTTGSLTICDVLFGTAEEGETYVVSLKAGETEFYVTGALILEPLYRFSLCSPVPEGVYYRNVRNDFFDPAFSSVDLITSNTTPPGHYVIDYVEVFSLQQVKLGQLDLTVQVPDRILTACFNVLVDGPILINQHVNLSAYCSTAPAGQTIVQYKWWFDYSGGPTSLPSATTSEFQIDHTYVTAGQRTVRLVVVSNNGDEAATAQSITVVAP